MQSKRSSAVEALVGTTIGFFTSLGLGMIVYPMFGHRFSFSENLWIVVIFTVVSVLRSYLVRRLFNWLPKRIEK